MVRDLAQPRLADASCAVADGAVRLELEDSLAGREGEGGFGGARGASVAQQEQALGVAEHAHLGVVELSEGVEEGTSRSRQQLSPDLRGGKKTHPSPRETRRAFGASAHGSRVLESAALEGSAVCGYGCECGIWSG